MKEVYGGLFFENVVNQDKNFEQQCRLFSNGTIHGVQLRVAHPSFTPNIAEADLLSIIQRLPDGCGVFVHFGAENVGVDFGETFDENGIYQQKGKGEGSWSRWNQETIRWGIKFAIAAGLKKPYGGVHPGYRFYDSQNDDLSEVIASLYLIGPANVLLENVPPVVFKGWFPEEKTKWWAEKGLCWWGVGGTPKEMSALLRNSYLLSSKCLIDFTHIVVMVNQAKSGYIAYQRNLTLKEAIKGFLDLSHSDICHFSGAPSGLIDEHTDLSENPSVEIAEGLKEMQVVCLEIPWHKMDFDQAKAAIERFRDGYKFF